MGKKKKNFSLRHLPVQKPIQPRQAGAPDDNLPYLRTTHPRQGAAGPLNRSVKAFFFWRHILLFAYYSL